MPGAHGHRACGPDRRQRQGPPCHPAGQFVLLGERIVFRTIPGTKLGAATASCRVAFQVDSYSPDGTSGWSVLVQGVSSEITDPEDLIALAGIPLRPWALDDRIATRLVRIESSFISGRRFSNRQI